MFVCSSCGKEHQRMGFCPSCSDLFCQQCLGESSSKCPRCEKQIKKVTIKISKISGLNIEWVKVDDNTSKEIGFIGFKEIPVHIPLINDIDPVIEQIIICPDVEIIRTASIAFAQNLSYNEPHSIPSLDRIPDTFSRYRVIQLPDNCHYVVFLNASALSYSDINIVLHYLSEYQKIWNSLKSFDATEFRHALIECEATIQRSMGMPFYVASDQIKNECQELPIGLVQSWVEFESLQHLYGQLDPSEFSKFVKAKLATTRNSALLLKDKFKDGGIFFGLAPIYIRANAICMASAGTIDSHHSYLQQIYGMHTEVMNRAEEVGVHSLSAALSELLSLLTDYNIFKDWDTYQKKVSSAIIAASTQLKSEFDDPTGSAALGAMCQSLCAELSVMELPVSNEVSHFFEMCDQISKNPAAQKMLILTACRTKLLVLEALGYHLSDPFLCPTIENIAKSNLLRFENEVNDIVAGYSEKIMDAGDLIIDINNAIAFCAYYENFDAVKRLRTIIEERADKVWAKTAIATILWTDYTTYEDYSALQRFRVLLPEIRFTVLPQNIELEPMFSILEKIADAVLIPKSRFENLTTAQLEIKTMEPTPFLFFTEQLQYDAMGIILDTLPFLYRAAEATRPYLLASNLHNAVEACQKFQYQENPESPNYLFFLKTSLLEAIAVGDEKDTRRIVNEIKNHRYHSKTTDELINIANNWADIRGGEKDSILRALDPQSQTPSPWVQTALTLLSKDAKAAYLQIVGFIGKGKAIQDGHDNFWKGTSLELALHICYLKDNFDVDSRVRIGRREKIDLLCHRKINEEYQIHLVDVKATTDRYAPSNAQEFITRSRSLTKHLNDYVPLEIEENKTVTFVVASMGGITQGAMNELLEAFSPSELIILTGEKLEKILKEKGMNFPSFNIL